MPEGPELALSRDFLKQEVRGKTIISSTVHAAGRYRDKPPSGLSLCVMPQEVFDICVKGKFMYWPLANNNSIIFLLCTYGMSGQWQTVESKHTAFSFEFSDGSHIYFNDPRHFGTLKFGDWSMVEKKLNSLGPDMLNSPPSLTDFYLLLAQQPSHKTLAEVLMNQKVVSGIGNYIKAEALYRARLSPFRCVGSLSDAEESILYDSIKEVMQTAYTLGGASISTYYNVDGSKGNAKIAFAVYKRNFDPEGREVISSKTRDGRTSWWCPEVQR